MINRPSYFIRDHFTHDRFVISYNNRNLIKKNLLPKIWQEHLKNDLLPYWNKEKSTELEYDLFPSFRTNTGQVISNASKQLSSEVSSLLADPETIGFIEPEYNYVKMHAAQTYAYGIAYHMTGDESYLQLCKKGAYALIFHAKDPDHGFFTRQNRTSGTWGTDLDKRTCRELAEGLSGISMFYYLTHDKTALHTILEMKEYIFSTYFSDTRGSFATLPQKSGSKFDDIMTQAEQLHSYMLLVTPALPEPYRSQWKNDIRKITALLIRKFYSIRYGFLTENTCFGHLVKIFSIIYEAGCLLDDIGFIDFARRNMDIVLDDAFVGSEENIPGNWGYCYRKDGLFDNKKEWWQFAQLNQACSILSLNDTSYLEYLNDTYQYWFDFMVDKENGEIWHMVDGETNEPILKYPKTSLEKSCHQSFEHCLIGYLTSSHIHNRNYTLYYAFQNEMEASSERIHPYFFDGCIEKINMEYFREIDDTTNKIKITFRSVY